jgi:hypothetical protein
MSRMKDLLGDTPYNIPTFDGATYDAHRDYVRLKGQLLRVFEHMKDGQWRSLASIVLYCGGTEASISARLRDLRKPKFGMHQVERRNIHGGLWQYRVVVKSTT